MRTAKVMMSVVLWAAACATHADEIRPKEVYKRTLPGAVAMLTRTKQGSGWVVDVRKRWVMTSQHVIGTAKEAEVIFPALGARPAWDRGDYLAKARRYRGRVIAADAKRDLALVELDDPLPKGVTGLKLAGESGKPGDRLHLIGNPSASGAMWVYTSGTLRAVCRKRFIYTGTKHEVHCVVGETQLPANPGDSGGPVVNDRSEVLGIQASASHAGAQLLTSYIDVGEVRAFLASVKAPADTAAP